MAIYWKQNHKYFDGISWWVLSLIMQTIGFLLLGIRGTLHDFITIVVSNTMIVSASLFLYIGFKQLVAYKARNIYNYILIIVYFFLQYYFTFIQPSGSSRIILISIFTSIMFLQSARLLLSTKKHDLILFTKTTGIICYTYILVQIFRIIVESITPTTDYFNASFLATIAQLVNQFMTIAIVFSFIIMVNSLNLHTRLMNERKLKENEKKLQDFIKNTYDWEFWAKNDGSIDYMSPSVERITGYKGQEFTDNPNLIIDIIHPEDLDKFKNHVHMEKCSLEFRIMDKYGEIHWVEHACQQVFGIDGGLDGRRVSNRDITDRKKYQEEIFSNHKIIEDLYNNAPCGYHSIDKMGLFINMNETELDWI
jgi:PAS domain S-box-containing protein